jgi:hypothetical protein
MKPATLLSEQIIRTFGILLVFLALRSHAASDSARSIRVVPLAGLVHTNPPAIRPRTTVTGGSLRVTVPLTNASFLIREGGLYRLANPVVVSSTNRTYEIKSNAVYVIQKPAVPRSLTTNATLFPSEVGTRVGDKDITGTIAARLESDELEYDHKNHQYGGTVVFCFRSEAKPELAQKLLPLSLRLYHSAGVSWRLT